MLARLLLLESLDRLLPGPWLGKDRAFGIGNFFVHCVGNIAALLRFRADQNISDRLRTAV